MTKPHQQNSHQKNPQRQIPHEVAEITQPFPTFLFINLIIIY